MRTLFSALLLVAVACDKGPVQKASVPDKVTTLQVPHTAEECAQLSQKPVPKGKCKGSIWFNTHLSEIGKREKELASYTTDRKWLVNEFTYDHLLNAVSPSARKKWLTGSGATDYEDCPSLEAALCKVAQQAEQKLPQFLPNTKAYSKHDSAEEKLMLEAIKDLESHTVFYVGLEESSWQIDKNGLGLPIARYKHGMAWARFAPDDHPYCWAYYINVVQEYSGGGNYGDTGARVVDYNLVGCPKS